MAWLIALFVSLALFFAWAVCAIWQHMKPSPPPLYDYKPNPTMTCDGCGSGPWHKEWDPDSERRKSRNFYCPNCLGAD